jgi:hypothetical protein
MTLLSGLKSSNALFRHEIAYVLGQIQSENSVEQVYSSHLNCTIVARNIYCSNHRCKQGGGEVGGRGRVNIIPPSGKFQNTC